MISRDGLRACSRDMAGNTRVLSRGLLLTRCGIIGADARPNWAILECGPAARSRASAIVWPAHGVHATISGRAANDCHRERPHAVGAHVADRHWRLRLSGTAAFGAPPRKSSALTCAPGGAPSPPKYPPA
jgi:hypothetical protein